MRYSTASVCGGTDWLGIGLIEGFYGHPWSWARRLEMADFLATEGYHFYLYAPKSDRALRQDWQRPHAQEDLQALRVLSHRCRSKGLLFGIGLSPLSLQENWERQGKQFLRKRLHELEEIGVDILCLLFDDMPGPEDRTAGTQADISVAALRDTDVSRLIVCPGYYSRDPKLEQLYGPRPSDYWECLGDSLPREVDVFWTGEQVCSIEFAARDLKDISERLGRPPVLWDNYPVNDGKLTSRFLNLDAYRGRSHWLHGLTRGHAANPMIQPLLSRIPLATLPEVYARGDAYDPCLAFRAAVRRLCGGALADALERDRMLFQVKGLDGIDPDQRAVLRTCYAGFESPYAREVVAWLDGQFRFDPACLTG